MFMRLVRGVRFLYGFQSSDVSLVELARGANADAVRGADPAQLTAPSRAPVNTTPVATPAAILALATEPLAIAALWPLSVLYSHILPTWLDNETLQRH